MIGFIIKYRSILIMAFLVGALFFYGNAQYRKGYEDREKEFNLAENKTLKDNSNIWKGANREVNLLKDDDLDRAGAALGILRADDNR